MYKPSTVLKRIIVTLLIISGILYAPALLAQQPLGKPVSVHVVNKPIDSVLALVSRYSHVNFSYVGTPFRKDSLVNIAVRNKNVKQVLDMLFDGRMQYIESGDNIILQRADVYRERNYSISGYVRDRENGAAITNASIYERTTLVSTFTDGTGYFHLRLKDKGRQPSAQLTISKELYLDTALYVMPGFDREISITISPAKAVLLKEFTVSDQVDRTWIGKRLLSAGLRRQTQNISRFLADKPFQSSIVPSVGTHGKMAGQVVNKVSLNLVGGYSMGLNGAEIAGGFNINKKDVQYVQAAGIFNVVGGNVTGAQFTGGVNQVMGSVGGAQAAGIINLSKKVSGAQMAGLINRADGDVIGMQASGIYNKAEGKMEGMQAGGLINKTRDSLKGLQTAGLISYTGGSLSGVQASGFYNHAGGNTTGAQASGFLNLVLGDYTGTQVTGAFNIVRGKATALQICGVSNFNTDSTYGFQLAGFFNYSGKTMSGLQFAGIANNTNGDLSGAQIAAFANRSNGVMKGFQWGFVNYARQLKGVQIGLINISDTTAGYSIGAINIARKGGYYKLSLSNTDFMPVQVAFKSGRRQFYAILAGGYNDAKEKMAAGLGIGHLFRFTQKLGLAAELLSQNIFDKNWKSLGQVYRIQPQLQYSFNKWITVHAGPAVSFSGDFRNAKLENGNGAWAGWQAGVSFF